MIRSGANLDQKVTYFHQMLRQDFALAEISRFVLGPYWRVASGAQRREFRSLFEDYLAYYYGQQFSQYWRRKPQGERWQPIVQRNGGQVASLLATMRKAI